MHHLPDIVSCPQGLARSRCSALMAIACWNSVNYAISTGEVNHLTGLLADTCRTCRTDVSSRAADFLQQSSCSSLRFWHLHYAPCPAQTVSIKF